jgi:hypothetical protein
LSIAAWDNRGARFGLVAYLVLNKKTHHYIIDEHADALAEIWAVPEHGILK